VRLLICVVVVVACRHAGDYGTPATVPEPPQPRDSPASDPAIEAVDGVAPASAPVGDPIAITYVPSKVGDARELTLHMAEVYDTVIDRGRTKRHQVSDHTYRMREEITALDGARIKAVRATVHEAHESIVMDGDPHEQELLGGTYLVTMEHGNDARYRIRATHETGGDVASRELEELDLLFGIDSGDEPALVQIVGAHPLRLHETVTLSDADKQLYAHGPPAKEPISLALVDASGGFATYEIDLTRDDHGGDASEVVHVRERTRLRIATGQIVEQITVSNKSEHATGMDHDERAKAELTFSLVPR
jgi:hypothetical protein